MEERMKMMNLELVTGIEKYTVPNHTGMSNW